MSIWITPASVATLNTMATDTLVEHIGIEFTEIGDDYLKARMPVDRRTVQPARILHGGASVVLAETLGSVAAYLCIDPARKMAVGLAINANHIQSVREGYVTGTAKPLHLGSSTQIWQIHIHDRRNRLVCVSRITLAVLDHSDRGVPSEEER
ncbi:MAG: hotdog fold thioesterase [Desulfobacterales bacterium]